MDEATLERHLHLTMTLIGGFMGGYAILNRHDVFGSAQTGNMISLAMDAVGHPDEQWFFRVLALVIYIVSMAATVVISHKISKINQKRLSILIDGAVLLILGFYPKEMNPFVALFPIFFASVCYRIYRISVQQRYRISSKRNLFRKGTDLLLRRSCNCFSFLQTS